MKRRKWCGRAGGMLTAAALAVTSLSSLTVSSVSYNTWTGYVLRTGNGEYLTAMLGDENIAREDIEVATWQADGTAPYNTWYFTEQDGGFTLKVAMDQGQYYLSENTSYQEFPLQISTTPSVFHLDENGTLIGPSGNGYWTLKPEPVTNLVMGDMNQDGRVNGMDLAAMRQAVLLAASFEAEVGFAAMAFSDVNGDGKLDNGDIQTLQNFLLGEGDLAEVQMPSCTIQPPEIAYNPQQTTASEQTTAPEQTTTTEESTTTTTITTISEEVTTQPPVPTLDMDDFPTDYREAADWIWNNRIEREQSTARQNTIFDQIVAGKGTLNYVVRWQSYKHISLEQRKQMEQMISDSINGWTDWLKGYDDWPYDHVDVKIVGWAVLDKSVLDDLQPDEIVYDNLIDPYDSSGDTSNGAETIPTLLPSAPSELSRFDHFADKGYSYPGGLDKRFDMYLWATQGFPAIGGCGGDWGQRLSDNAYLNMLDGTGLHVLEHELGHGFGMTDFYGGEGALDGFPPGGFPGGENSLMMAGSAAKITDFDGWMLRYIWSKIKDESGRFSY